MCVGVCVCIVLVKGLHLECSTFDEMGMCFQNACEQLLQFGLQFCYLVENGAF